MTAGGFDAQLTVQPPDPSGVTVQGLVVACAGPHVAAVAAMRTNTKASNDLAYTINGTPLDMPTFDGQACIHTTPCMGWQSRKRSRVFTGSGNAFDPFLLRYAAASIRSYTCSMRNRYWE
jgi:hypothetical protein